MVASYDPIYEPTWTPTADDVDEHIAPHLDSAALLIIDTQRDFVDGGATPVPGTSRVLPAVAAVRQRFLEAGRLVVHVVRLYDGDDVDLVRRTAIGGGLRVVAPGTPGAAVVPELWPAEVPDPDHRRLLAGDLVEIGPREVVMWKPRWSAFHRTGLDEFLRSEQVDTVVVAGCNFPNCPRATIVDASERDYRVLVVADAISGVEDHHLTELGLIGVLHTAAPDLVASDRRG